MADAVKQLKIKTGSVKRCIKDRTASDKEIDQQQQRIEKFKSDDSKDEHDVRKQVRLLSSSRLRVTTGASPVPAELTRAACMAIPPAGGGACGDGRGTRRRAHQAEGFYARARVYRGAYGRHCESPPQRRPSGPSCADTALLPRRSSPRRTWETATSIPRHRR